MMGRILSATPFGGRCWKTYPKTRRSTISNCAAKYLSVSKRTVQQLIRDGEMVPYRVGRGGHRRIHRTDLDGPMHREDHSGLVELVGAKDAVCQNYGITSKMLLTTEYKRGDIVLVNIVFAEETGSKRRPVLILSSNRYMEERQDVIASAITGDTRRLLVGDHLILDWEAADLLLPSVTTGIIRTIKQSMIKTKMGEVSLVDLDEIESNLTQILGLTS